MAFQETTRTSYGSKVKNSFRGILGGIILIIAGTIVLWWNEGRAVKASDALKDFQKNYVELSDINTIDPGFEGKAVHASGIAVTSDTLRDSSFGIAVNAMSLEREVEYYQWVQESSSESKDKLGGSTETTTTYTYKPAWCSRPVNSEDFKDPDYKGRNFVLKSIDNLYQNASDVSFGAYKLNESIVRSISGEEPAYPALSENLKSGLLSGIRDTTVAVSVKDNRVYIGADPDNPRIGDIRITFTQVTSPKTISLLQKVVNNTFESYIAKNGREFSKVEMGTVSAENMIEHQKAANKTMLWIFRILGIIVVLAGFRSLLSFISTVFAVIPFVQRILGAGIGLVTNIVGLVWSFIVIALAWAAHRPVVAIALLILAGALVFWLITRSRKKKMNNVAALLLLCIMLGAGAGCSKDHDAGGRQVLASASDAKGPVKTISYTQIWSEGIPSSTIYEFDRNQRLVSTREENGFDDYQEEGECDVIESMSEKDSEDRYTKMVWGCSGVPESTTLYEYDGRGNVTFQKSLDRDGNLLYEHNHTYDSEGKLLESTYRSIYGESSTSYDYDTSGNLVKTTSKSNGKTTYFNEYSYDGKGHQVYSKTYYVNTGTTSENFTTYAGDEIVCTTLFDTDGNGRKMTFRDSTYTDSKGMRHQIQFTGYSDESRTLHGVFNKDYLTRCDIYEGQSDKLLESYEFKYFSDGETIDRVNYTKYSFGQAVEERSRSFTRFDTFGNWISRAKGPVYLFGAPGNGIDEISDMLNPEIRRIEFYGEDQGMNHGFSGKAGNCDIRLVWSESGDVLKGEGVVDGSPTRIAGYYDIDRTIHVAAIGERGEIQWSMTIPDGTGKREGTLLDGDAELSVSLSPIRDNLRTFSFEANSNDVVGIYEFRHKGRGGSGTLDISRSGDDWEFLDIVISRSDGLRSNASDSFNCMFGENTVFNNYLWDEGSSRSGSYRVLVFDDFAVVLHNTRNIPSFFHGISLEGVYAKLPSVG